MLIANLVRFPAYSATAIKEPDGQLTSRLKDLAPDDAVLVAAKTTCTLLLDSLIPCRNKLQKGDLVTATKRVRGGFLPARQAGPISVLDVVAAIDGDKSLFDCRAIWSRCALFGSKPAYGRRAVYVQYMRSCWGGDA
jgi:hypothetical protein